VAIQLIRHKAVFLISERQTSLRLDVTDSHGAIAKARMSRLTQAQKEALLAVYFSYLTEDDPSGTLPIET
jgi:hypothetical protein